MTYLFDLQNALKFMITYILHHEIPLKSGNLKSRS